MIFTTGHSTLTQDAFLALLGGAGVRTLWDVRSYPSSRWEWFRREQLDQWLPAAGVGYVWVPALGGRRKGSPAPDEAHGWQEEGFAAYQWHMTTREFLQAADELVELGRRETVAIMCAEVMWWRCHRSMIADYLVIAGASVVHLQPRRLDHSAVLGERVPRYAPSVIATWRHHLAPSRNPTPDDEPAAGA